MSKSKDKIDLPDGSEEKEEKSYSDILAEARERMYSSSSGWDFILQRIRDDIEFSSGRQWDPATEKVRQDRPNLVIDKTRKFVDKVVGAYRNSPPGINVSPRYESSEFMAEAYECYIRNVLSQPNSKAAIETGGEHAAICGYGWLSLGYDFETDKSFDLIPKLVRIDDPRSVRIDTASVESDGSDAQWGFRLLRIDKKEAERKYGPDVASWETIPSMYTDQWVDDEQLILAQYWWIDEIDDVLLKVRNPLTGETKAVLQSQVKEDSSLAVYTQVIMHRATKRKQCNYAFLSGAGVIETSVWACSDIPLIPVYGRQAFMDNRQFYMGIIRPLMDTQRLINYYASTMAEVTALSPRTPFIIAEGQIEGFENEWELSNIKNFPYLQYRAIDVSGNPIGAPQRAGQTGDISPLLQATQATTSDLTDVSGIYDASLGADTTQKSGVAIREASKNTDQVVACFGDNLKRAVVRCAQQIAHMMPNLISEGQKLKLTLESGEMLEVTQNSQTPVQHKQIGMKAPAVLDFTIGEYEISIESGDSYSTRRQESAAASMELMSVMPDVQKAAIAPEVVAQQDWVGADRMSRILKATLPPDLQGVEDEDAEEGIPPQAKALLDSYQQEIQTQNQDAQNLQNELKQCQQEIQELKLSLKDNSEDISARERIADKDNQTKLLLKLLDNQSTENVEAAKAFMKKELEEKKIDIEADRMLFDAHAHRMDTVMAMTQPIFDGLSASQGATQNHRVPNITVSKL